MKPVKLTPVILISLSLVLMLSGCSGKPDRAPTVQVHGKVTYKGEALKRGTIVFFPKGGKKLQQVRSTKMEHTTSQHLNQTMVHCLVSIK